MAFKIRVKSPSLRDLVEIQNDSNLSIYPVPFGKLSDLGKIVIKRAVSWKGVKGEAYKKNYKTQYEHQQEKAGVIRNEARKVMKANDHVAVVLYASGEYGILPAWSAYLAEKGSKGKLSIVKSDFPNKEAALSYIRSVAGAEYERLLEH